MTFDELEVVSLKHDIKNHGLNKGDIGTIVEVYNNGDAYEVEFVDNSGRTTALLTLTEADITKEPSIGIKSNARDILNERFSDRSWIKTGKSESSTQLFYAVA